MIKISPSVLSADFANMGAAAELMEKCGADYIHCDVMDGAFVPNISFGSAMVKAISKHTTLPLDVHLMIERPERYIDDFAAAGAGIITVHAEATPYIQRVLTYIRSKGIKSGIVLNPATPVEHIEYCMDCIDMVLLMSVNPGFGGQKFIPSVLPKISKVRDMIEKSGYDIELEVDGGVNLENVGAVLSAGADVIVAGSAIFGHKDPAEAIRKLRG